MKANVAFKTFKCACALFVLMGMMGCSNIILNLKADNFEKPQSSKKSFKILVKHFDDQREDTEHFGEKKGGFGNHLGWVELPQGENLADEVSEDFTDRLLDAGYQAVMEGGKKQGTSENSDAVLEGEIHVFKILTYMQIVQNIEISVKLHAAGSSKILWKQTYKTARTDLNWVGATGEFERIMNKAYADIMQKAVDDFASSPFEDAVKSSKP